MQIIDRKKNKQKRQIKPIALCLEISVIVLLLIIASYVSIPVEEQIPAKLPHPRLTNGEGVSG